MKFEKVIFEFDELQHKYCLNGIPLISVSKIIEQFTPEFDEEYFSLYTAIRYRLKMTKPQFSSFLKENYGYDWKGDREYNYMFLQNLALRYNVTKEDIQTVLDEWAKTNKDSLEKGTKFHNEQEGTIIIDKGKKFGDTYFEYASFPDLTNLVKDVPVVYPELRMYNAQYGIAGTSDEVYMFPNGDFIISDWKTNKEIKTSNRFTKMLAPISHLDDCNYIHYKLQLSTYAWMLEQFGYRCISTSLTHVELDSYGKLIKSHEYIFNTMPKEVKLMLKNLKR